MEQPEDVERCWGRGVVALQARRLESGMPDLVGGKDAHILTLVQSEACDFLADGAAEHVKSESIEHLGAQEPDPARFSPQLLPQFAPHCLVWSLVDLPMPSEETPHSGSAISGSKSHNCIR